MVRSAEQVARLQKQRLRMRENLRRRQDKRRKERAAREGQQRKEKRAKKEAVDLAKKREEELVKVRAELVEVKKNRKVMDDELNRLRSRPENSGAYVAEGAFEWVVEVKKVGENNLYGRHTAIGRCSFTLGCRIENDYIVLVLNCKDAAGTSTSAVMAGFTVKIDSTCVGASITKTDTYLFPHVGDFPSWEWIAAKWKNLTKPAKGFVYKEDFFIKIEFKILAYHANAIADFSVPGPLCDVTLIVVGEEFHVNKMFLAHHSRYFQTMFFSDVAEKDKARVELPDVEGVGATYFREMLQLIHPQKEQIEINQYNVLKLLPLANYFDVQSVIWRCSDYLKGGSPINTQEVLRVAQQFRLHDLVFDVLNNPGNYKPNFNDVIPSKQFKGYSLWLQKEIMKRELKRRGMVSSSDSSDSD